MIMRESRLVVATRLGWPGVRLGFPGLRGLGQVLCPGGVPCAGGLPNFNEQQWYELIALTTNHPLASVQATYSALASESNFTNLQIALGQWPGGIAHSAYLAYQQGNIVDAVQGGHYFQYGGAWAGMAGQLGFASINPWAIPAQQPSAQQVTAATTAMFGQYKQEMSAPVYSQPQAPAAQVIAAYNAANPQAPVSPSAAAKVIAVQAAAPTTSTTQQQTTGSVQAGTTGTTTTNGTGTSTTSTTTSTGNFLTASLFGGIPNWMLLGGGAAVLFLVMQHGGRR